MSALEPEGQERYFVDYEIWYGGQAIAWGQLVQLPSAAATVRDDDTLIEAIRQRAGHRHGAEADQVRIRMLVRL